MPSAAWANAQIAQACDPPRSDGDIADGRAIVIDDGATFQNEIIGRGIMGFLDRPGGHT